MDIGEEQERAREARRERGREARRLAREAPDAPPEPFFSADELACLERQLLYNRNLKRPDTIRDAVMLAGSLARLSRNSDIVYLPSLGTLEDAFATLEKQVLIIQLARSFGMAELLEASKGRGDEKTREEFHRLSCLSSESIRQHLGRDAGLKACERLSCLSSGDRGRALGSETTMQALKALADMAIEDLRRKLKTKLDPHELELLRPLPPESRKMILDNPASWRIFNGLIELAVEELLRRQGPEALARNVGRLTSLLSTGRMDIASKEGAEKTFKWLVKLIAGDAEQGPGAKAGVKAGIKADVERRESPADLAYARVMRRLGIEQAMQDLERLAALDVESLHRELGIEDTVKSIRQLKRLFGTD